MNLEKIKQGIELAKLLDGDITVDKYPFSVGDKVFIRTVTLYYTGEIISGLVITIPLFYLYQHELIIAHRG